MEFTSLTRIGLCIFGTCCASICNLSTLFSTMHGLGFISAMAFIKITQDANIHGNMVLMSWSFVMSGKVTKYTYWHNEKVVLVCIPIKKPLGYKRFLALPKLTHVPTP